ncbi:MAG TPA: tetratricopeptide repeat protein, partial [Herpetosiphonaceae bacterium]|nr:tetratricopeptide repeat protein [Herpetosiphonaceae bacterium]
DVPGAVADLADAVRQLAPGSAPRALTLRRLALALMHAGQYDEASTVSGHAATLAPGDPTVASIQGQLAQQRGDMARAVQYYARAVALDPSAGRHHLRLGGALLEAGEIEVARDHLEQATELEPARALGWVLLSQVLLRLRQPERGLTAAQRATQLAHTDGSAWRQLAAAAAALGEVDMALDAFERATALHADKEWFVDYADFAFANGRDERGRSALQQAAHLAPDAPELAYRLAQLSQGQERAAQLERAVQLEPANAAWRNELARLLATKGQHRSAIAHLTQAVDSEPHKPEHWIALSDALLKAGDDFAAEANLRRGLDFQPQRAELWLTLGGLLARRQQWNDAYTSFVRAAENEPSAAAFAGQGHCLLRLEQIEPARQALQHAVKIDDQDADAWADLARTYFLQRRWKEAIRDARRALAINPTLVDAYRTVAEAALELKGDWINDAHEALEHALSIEPDAAHLHALRGWAYYAEGAYTEALDSARTALHIAPDEATYYLLEAYALRRMRLFREAIESLRKATKLNRNYREALQELMTLTSEMFLQGERP